MLSSSRIHQISIVALMIGLAPLPGCALDAAESDESTSEAKQADTVVATSLDFGGAYGYVHGNPTPNPVTGDMSCPAGYTATQSLGIINVDYPMFFCSRPHQVGVEPEVDFGGMWGYVNGALVNNPITGTASCPAGYAAQTVLDTTNKDYSLNFCYKYHALGTNPDYPFGGMWGYVSGAQTQNPATGAASCPAGHIDSQVFGTTNVDYPLHFCWLRQGEQDFGGAFGYVNGNPLDNPATGGMSCPAGYTATQVLGTSYVDYPVVFCSRPHQAGVDPVFDFGGMWGYVNGALVNNPITGTALCPAEYTDQAVLGTTATDHPLHVCYKAHTPGTSVAFHFGGMWGHVNGAPVANPATAEASCPAGYFKWQVLGTSGVDYPVNVCWQFGAGPYTAQAQIASAIVYDQVTATITLAPNKNVSFLGHAGGLTFPGGNGSWGSLFTDDVQRLYRDTVSFEFNATAIAFNINFFDANSNNLGSYVGGGIGTVTGIGGGAGQFSGLFPW